jgi:hypothetical protein
MYQLLPEKLRWPVNAGVDQDRVGGPEVSFSTAAKASTQGLLRACPVVWAPCTPLALELNWVT